MSVCVCKITTFNKRFRHKYEYIVRHKVSFLCGLGLGFGILKLRTEQTRVEIGFMIKYIFELFSTQGLATCINNPNTVGIYIHNIDSLGTASIEGFRFTHKI